MSPVAWCTQELCSVTTVSTSFPLTFPLGNVGTETVPFFLQGSEAVQMENVTCIITNILLLDKETDQIKKKKKKAWSAC